MTTTRLSSPPAARKQAPAAPRAHGGLRSLAVDVGVPIASYYLLRKAGCDVVTSLAVSSAAPAAHAVLDLVRGRVVSGMAVLVLVLQEPIPSVATLARVPWWAWSGGMFGAVFIGLGIVLVPKLGAATFFALLVAGQMIGSMVFDHFGILGLPVNPISLTRLIGAGLLVGGVLLIRL